MLGCVMLQGPRPLASRGLANSPSSGAAPRLTEQAWQPLDIEPLHQLTPNVTLSPRSTLSALPPPTLTPQLETPCRPSSAAPPFVPPHASGRPPSRGVLPRALPHQPKRGPPASKLSRPEPSVILSSTYVCGSLPREDDELQANLEWTGPDGHYERRLWPRGMAFL